MNAITFASFAVLTVALPAAVMGSESPSPPQPAATAPRAPMIVQNPDGTMTVQKERTQGTGKTGLLIPAQVIVPITPPK